MSAFLVLILFEGNRSWKQILDGEYPTTRLFNNTSSENGDVSKTTAFIDDWETNAQKRLD